MADAYLLQLDMEKIRARLKWSDGKPATMEQARHWLKRSDFEEGDAPDVWVAEEISLRVLRREEILRSKLIT